MVVINLPGEMQELYSFASLSATNIWAEEDTPVLWSGVSQAAGPYWEPVLCWGGFRSAGGCGPQPYSPVPRCHTHTTPSAVTSKSPDMAVQRGPNPSLVEKPLSYSDRRTKSKVKDSLQISSTLQFPRSVDLVFLHYFKVSPKFHIFPME